MPQWTVTLLPVAAMELEGMPADIRARFGRIANLIETRGLNQVREPHIKHVHDRIWEMRMAGRDGIARALYVATTGRVVVVRVFMKKSQKTPPREIRLAQRRAKEVA
jgi:phage-related protein